MTADRIDELLRLASQRALSLARLPGSTYRIQFHAGFTFQNATAIVPYLADLGITHLYASPYLAAVAGSMHGYDVIDHDRLNPELGTEADYEELLRVLKRYGLSHILDTVPNHVGVDTNDNAWWNSVLEHGRASPFARYFDISWRGSASADLHDRVLIPILGDSYGKVLEGGQLKVEYEGDTDRLVVVYFNRRFPISPSTRELVFGKSAADSRDMGHAITELNGSPGDPRTFDRLDALLQAQHYRLAWWRAAPDEINYRRFFDINGLAALAMERAEVFIAAHAFTLRLAAQAKITGLRVDHPDGLYDPKKYFRRLQQHYLVAIAEEIARESPDWRDDVWKEVEPELIARLSAREKDAEEATAPLLYVVAEKILAADEGLPSDWSCHGTSGYDFLVMVNELFVDQANEAAFSRLYESISRQTDGFGELAYRNKLFVLNQSFAGDLHRLTRRLQRLAANDRRARDFSFRNLQDALRELIACFPVYRTYIDSDCVSGQDQSYLESAAKDAIDRNPKMQAEVFHFVRDMLLQLPADSFTFPDRARQLRLAGKFQQLTSPVMAKGVEDTAFYQYQRLIALNEVGGDPGRFGIDPAELHRYLSHRQQSWPFALNALSTHDTKRSEDVRARINVLSEMPVEWEARVRRWMTLNASQRDNIGGIPAPAPDEEYLLYQTLIGIWPLSGAAGVDDTFIRRVLQFMQKALREAKLRTSWTEPAPQWEAAVENFVRRILDKSSAGEFLADVSSFVQTVSHYGLINSLSQTAFAAGCTGCAGYLSRLRIVGFQPCGF